MARKAQVTRKKQVDWTSSKMKGPYPCVLKDPIKLKTQPIEWEKIFENHVTRYLYPEYIKNTYNSTIKRQFSLKNGQFDRNRYISKEEIQMSKKHMKKI